MKIIVSRMALGLLMAVIVSACSLPKFSLPNLKPQAATEIPTAVSPAQATRASTATVAAPEPAHPQVHTAGELALAAFTGTDQEIHGLILFTSPASDPFSTQSAAAGPILLEDKRLWAISTDGAQAGALSDTSAALAPARSGADLARVVDAAQVLNSALLERVALPVECDPSVGGTCSGYQFSYNRRLLLYYTSPAACGQALTLYDTDRQTALHRWPNAQWALFLSDGSIVLSLGDCEKQYVYQYLPNQDRQSGIGPAGTAFWNPSRQAFLMQVQGQPAMQAGLWGLNLETARVFLWLDQRRVIQDSPTWLPDGKHFVFQHRAYRYDNGSGDALIDYPRQIVLMDAWTRSQHLLAYEPTYNFHLCQSAGKPCNAVSGDWLKVRRTPVLEARFAADQVDHLPAARCALFALDCPTSDEELLAINWRSSEILPWGEANVPEPQAQPAYAAPDMESQPVYTDPVGAYALYTGAGGQGLWYVPQAGEPVRWVANGSDFVFLP